MNVSHLPAASLLLSVILHVAVFHTLIFTFPLNPAAHKPNLIFLGPILKKVDVAQSKETITQKQPLHLAGAAGIMDKTKTTTPSPFRETALPKPFMEAAGAAGEKVTLKSTFEIPQINAPAGGQDMKEEGIDLKIAPYHPLRLRRK